jgi:hypothetical protein
MSMTRDPARLDADSIASSISLKSLVDGFQNYRRTALNVLRYHRRYAEIYIMPYPNYKTSYSSSIVLYGVALSFVLYAPLIYKHGLHLGKIYFLLQFIYAIGVSLLSFHFSARIFGGRGTIRQTSAVYCTWVGFSIPVALLIDYPLFYYMPVEDFIAVQVKTVPKWVEIWNAGCFIVLIAIGAIMIFSWMASVHKMRMWKILLSWFVVYLPVNILLSLYVSPIVSRLIRTLAEIGDNII